MALGKYGPQSFSFRPADATVFDLHGRPAVTYTDSTGTTTAPPLIDTRGFVEFWVEEGEYELLLSTAGDSGTVTQRIHVAPGGTDSPVPNGASVPSPTAGDAGKVVTVGSGGAYELDTPAAGAGAGLFLKVLAGGAGNTFGLNGLMPLIDGELMREGFPQTITRIGAGQVAARLELIAPTLPSGSIAVNVEVDVWSLDGTEELSCYNSAPIILTSGEDHIVLLSELDGLNEQVGTDLTIGQDGTHGWAEFFSTAGGVFQGAVYVDATYTS